MEMYSYKQMKTDLQHSLAQNPRFLDQLEIPADPYVLNLMSLGLRRRYYNESYLDDIKRASVLLEVAMQNTPVASQGWLSSVYSLCRTYFLYYNGTSDIHYLQQTIRLSEQLIEHTDSASPGLARSLHYLASCLVIRARQTHNLSDLRRAGHAWRECVHSIPEASPDRNTYISRLFFCLLASYHLEDATMDLEDAINLLHLLLNKSAIEASKCPIMIGFIANSMMKCYFQTQQISDLNTIIQAWEHAVACTPSHIAYLSDLNSMLATSLLARFLILRDDNDLQKAIATQEEALYLCKPKTLKYIQNLHDLGQTLMIRYKRTKSMADVNHAIVLFEQALAALAGLSSLRQTYQKSLIEALYQRYLRTADTDDFKRIQQLRSQH